MSDCDRCIPRWRTRCQSRPIALGISMMAIGLMWLFPQMVLADEASVADRYGRGVALYDRASALHAANDPMAREVFAHAAMVFDSLADPASEFGNLASAAETGPTSDPRLLRAAAFAYLFAQDAGRSVLYFERARFAAPVDRTVQAGAERARVLAGIDQSAIPRSTVEVVASYLELLPRPIRSWSLIVAWFGAWLAMCLRVGTRRYRPARVIPAVLFLLAALAACTLVPGEYLRLTDQRAIVVESSVLHADPSESEGNRQRDEPLKPGTGVQISGRVGDWTCITLPRSSERAWVRSSHVRRVFGE